MDHIFDQHLRPHAPANKSILKVSGKNEVIKLINDVLSNPSKIDAPKYDKHKLVYIKRFSSCVGFLGYTRKPCF